jgi:hypothetical protein
MQNLTSRLQNQKARAPKRNGRPFETLSVADIIPAASSPKYR